jgi:hypothetical protein
MRTVRSLLFRADPDTRELDLARAMAIEVLRTIDRVQGIYRGGYGKPGEGKVRGESGAEVESPS